MMKFMDYDEVKAEKVCAALAAGILLIEYCPSDEDIYDEIIVKKGRPRVIDVYQWLADKPDFAAVYKIARINQAMSMAERALVSLNNFVNNPVDAAMAKARSEALRWMAARMDRNTFGDQSNRVEPVQIIVRTTLGDEDTDPTIGQNEYKATVPVGVPAGAPTDPKPQASPVPTPKRGSVAPITLVQ